VVNRAVTSNATLPPAGADLGPSLASAAVTTPLANANGNVIASNDNWKDSQQAAIAATGKAPPNDNESAILGLLAPGNYTAIVAGKTELRALP
jgi:hypothetical protein